MDGTQLERGAILTGLDKLGRLQQSPYAFYYSGLSRDAMEADVILVAGSGLSDFHINTCLKAARRARPNIPVLYIGHWGSRLDDFYNTIHFEQTERDISLVHDLGIDLLKIREGQVRSNDGWTIEKKGSAALWVDGFQSFLNASDTFTKTLLKISRI